MANYHCSISIKKRSNSYSSLYASSYIGGTTLHDERLKMYFSHTTKEEVFDNQMIFAERVPNDLRTDEKFWNSLEKAEPQKFAQVAREFEISLPHELNLGENMEIAKKFAESLIEDGLPAVQFALHLKKGNLHAHFLTPLRDFNGKWLDKENKRYALDENGERIPIIDEKTGKQKVDSRNRKQWKRETIKSNKWNDRKFAEIWRKRVADIQNEALAKNGFSVRVDHRSYKRQGIDKIPQVHEGYNARKLEKAGKISDRCQINREIRLINAENAINKAKEEYFAIDKEIENLSKKVEQAEAVGIRQFSEIENIKKQRKEGKEVDRSLRSASTSFPSSGNIKKTVESVKNQRPPTPLPNLPAISDLPKLPSNSGAAEPARLISQMDKIISEKKAPKAYEIDFMDAIDRMANAKTQPEFNKSFKDMRKAFRQSPRNFWKRAEINILPKMNKTLPEMLKNDVIHAISRGTPMPAIYDNILPTPAEEEFATKSGPKCRNRLGPDWLISKE